MLAVPRHRGYSSVVEHSTADREVPGSNPGVPSCFAMCTFRVFVLLFCLISYRLRQLKVIVYFSESARTVAMGRCEGLEMLDLGFFEGAREYEYWIYMLRLQNNTCEYDCKMNQKVHRPGIEPGSPAWQARILPLNHRCSDVINE